ncbi:MAG: class I SAM-dependent RNA methyltransferase, partial [Bacteroidetes bacterium]|nr:class I SAM-dependent RNA methyltransferase [Bacteroidota bacterium]
MKDKNMVIGNVEVIDMGNKGKGVGKQDGMVIFVQGAIPGDVVDVKVTRKKKSFLEGRVDKYIRRSKDLVKPFCDHFEICGGCSYQHIAYEAQLTHKQKGITDNLSRIGKLDLPETPPIIGCTSTEFYRNKLEFTFSNKRWLTSEEIKSEEKITDQDVLGFHVSGRYAYVGRADDEDVNGDDTFLILDIGGLETTAATIHSLEAGDLQVRDNLLVYGDAYITTGLVVGSGGLSADGPVSLGRNGSLTVDEIGNVGIGTTTPGQKLVVVGNFNVSGDSIFRTTTDSTTGFQIQDVDGGTPIFNVDTTNERVGIRTTSPIKDFHLVSIVPTIRFSD